MRTIDFVEKKESKEIAKVMDIIENDIQNLEDIDFIYYDKDNLSPIPMAACEQIIEKVNEKINKPALLNNPEQYELFLDDLCELSHQFHILAGECDTEFHFVEFDDMFSEELLLSVKIKYFKKVIRLFNDNKNQNNPSMFLTFSNVLFNLSIN